MSIYPFPRPESRQSVPDLVRQLFAELVELIHQHIELTKTEVREESKRLSRALVFGLLGLIFFQVVLIFGGNLLLLLMLVNQVNLVAATGLTVVVFLILTIISVGLCIQQLKSAQALLKPEAGNG